MTTTHADMPLGLTGAFCSAGACPPLEPSIKLGATRVLLMMLGRPVLGDWAQRGIIVRLVPSEARELDEAISIQSLLSPAAERPV